MLSHLNSCADQTHKTIKVCRQYFIPYLVYNLHSRKLAEKVFKKGSKKKKKSTSMLKENTFLLCRYSLFPLYLRPFNVSFCMLTISKAVFSFLLMVYIHDQRKLGEYWLRCPSGNPENLGFTPVCILGKNSSSFVNTQRHHLHHHMSMSNQLSYLQLKCSLGLIS